MKLENLWFALDKGNAEYEGHAAYAANALPSVMYAATTPLGLVEAMRPLIELEDELTPHDKKRLVAVIEKIGLGDRMAVNFNFGGVEPNFEFICQHGLADVLGN